MNIWPYIAFAICFLIGMATPKVSLFGWKIKNPIMKGIIGGSIMFLIGLVFFSPCMAVASLIF